MGATLFTSPVSIVAIGGECDVSVLIVSSDPLTGLDYRLEGVNVVIVSRDITGSEFPDLIDPSLDGDLGASVADVRQALDPGEHLVATYHLRVSDIAQVATIKPVLFAGTVGYATQAPGFAEFPYATAGSTILTPEPWMGWLAMMAWLAVRRRRRGS